MVYPSAMPTNKLWLEHTERAAWDTIHTLREKLSIAEKRLQALAPGVASVEELLELIECARQKYAPESTSHAAVVTELITHIERLHTERASNQAPQSVISVAVPLPRPALHSEDLDERRWDSVDDDLEDLNRFARALRRKAECRQASAPQDIERLLQQAEDRLDEMSEADGVALRDAAVELAFLAARVYSLSRQDD